MERSDLMFYARIGFYLTGTIAFILASVAEVTKC